SRDWSSDVCSSDLYLFPVSSFCIDQSLEPIRGIQSIDRRLMPSGQRRYPIICQELVPEIMWEQPKGFPEQLSLEEGYGLLLHIPGGRDKRRPCLLIRFGGIKYSTHPFGHMSYVSHVLGLYIGIQFFCFFVKARFFIGPFDDLRKDLLQVDNSVLRCLHTIVSQILVLGSGVKRAAFG